MTLVHIGATASDNSAPCYPVDAWQKLVAAMEAGDSAAVIAITTSTRPTMVPTAKLKTVEPPSMAEAAGDYWRKRGKAPRAFASDASGVPIVAEVRS